MRKSQAFAAYRTQVISEANEDILVNLLPQFNSEIEDIRRQVEERKTDKGEASADHLKRARINDLKVRQQDFIESLNKDINERLSKRITEYGGTVETVKDGEKEVLQAIFPDKSTARVPKSLWVDYSQFHRV